MIQDLLAIVQEIKAALQLNDALTARAKVNLWITRYEEGDGGSSGG